MDRMLVRGVGGFYGSSVIMGSYWDCGGVLEWDKLGERAVRLE